MDNVPICYCTELRGASRRVRALYDTALLPAGIGAAQLALLRALGEVGRISLTDLGRELGLDRSTVGRNVRVLARKGLLRLDDDASDLRASAVAITPEGRDAVARAAPLWTDIQNTVRDRLGTRTVDRLLAVLTSL